MGHNTRGPKPRPGNPVVLLRDLKAANDHVLYVPGWERLELVHATVDNHLVAGGAQVNANRRCHQHGVFHAVVITKGPGSFMMDDEDVEFEGPMLFLVDPHQPHSFTRLPGQVSVYSEVTFYTANAEDGSGNWSDLLSRWTGEVCELPSAQAIPMPLATTLRALIAKVADQSLLARPGGSALARGHLAQVLLEIWSELVLGGEVHEQDPMEHGRRFLESNAHRAVSLEEFAEAVSLSPKHAGRAFRERFGDPPMKYHRSCSLRRAATLLRTTDHPLKQVARMCGFEEEHYFNRCFRRAFEKPPGAYRQQYVTVTAD